MNTKLTVVLFILLFIVLGIQSFWIFKDAEKRKMNKWLWGIFGFLNTPTNLIIYLLVSRSIMKKKTCINCGHQNSKHAKYCENCGEELEELQ